MEFFADRFGNKDQNEVRRKSNEFFDGLRERNGDPEPVFMPDFEEDEDEDEDS